MRPDAGRPPRLSVVMPSLNQGRFIAEAVASVLGARHPDVELVVADGGSTDGTLSLLAALGAEFGARLRWSSEPDGGPAAAVNRAVSLARAPLIGWLNSDDIYAEGAIERALAHFDAYPDHVMVYGEGQHVDEAGAFIERYPTRRPDAPATEFRNGCFICQPTAFFRRDAFEGVGALDTSLRAAFDFDLWLRMFKTFPSRIGFVDQVQAKSRLHAAGITLSQRGRVAREGIAVLGRHLGSAPPEWALTWLEELLAAHPFHPRPLSPRRQLESLVEECATALGADGVAELRRRLAADARLDLASMQVCVAASADGWAGELLEIRVWQQPSRLVRLELACRHQSPLPGPLRLEIIGPGGSRESRQVVEHGAFELSFDLSTVAHGAQAVYTVRCVDTFVPADCEPGSTDARRLGFRVESCRVLEPGA
jgi:hypothetical protein